MYINYVHHIGSLETTGVEWERPFEVECWAYDHCGVLRSGSRSGGKTSFKARWCEGAGFVTLLLYLWSLTHMSSTYTNLKLAIASSPSSLASKKVGFIMGTQIYLRIQVMMLPNGRDHFDIPEVLRKC